MPRASHGPAAPRVKSSPRSSQTAYPTPPSRRASRVAYPAPQPAYPIPPSHGPPAAPPSQPTLHPRPPRATRPAPAIPADLPYTRRVPDARHQTPRGRPTTQSQVSRPPDRPTLHRAPAMGKRPSRDPTTTTPPSPPCKARQLRRWRALAGKSRRRRAYPQQIVTTRLLYCLQDPFAQLSRLQRI
jgi:hypothetical protein